MTLTSTPTESVCVFSILSATPSRLMRLRNVDAIGNTHASICPMIKDNEIKKRGRDMYVPRSANTH